VGRLFVDEQETTKPPSNPPFNSYIDHKLIPEKLKMIIILEKEKITEDVKHKLIKKGYSLIGMSDTHIIFNKVKPCFVLY
jgi:hypothetical protein